MKVSYEEGLAKHFGPRRRCDAGNDVVLSVRHGGSVGQLWSSEITTLVCRPSLCQGKATPGRSNFGQIDRDTAESKNLRCEDRASSGLNNSFICSNRFNNTERLAGSLHRSSIRTSFDLQPNGYRSVRADVPHRDGQLIRKNVALDSYCRRSVRRNAADQLPGTLG